ncbi:MAG: asparaginase [Cyanophyceae cyanobacterium]
MTRAKQLRTTEIDVKLLREGIAESQHRAEAAVCDTRGRLLMGAGDPSLSAFVRSALKPFQALAAISTGMVERFGLSNRDLAVMCASHQGSVEQARQVFNILWRCDIDPSALQCPVPEGKESRLQHNCSGKHAGMLAACLHQGWPLADYMERNHPIQQAIAAKLGELMGMPPQEIIAVRDDCGVPTYLMQLEQMATLYAHLGSGQSLEMERIVRAMTSHPELVAGEGGFDTDLMRVTAGQLVSKSGAEGIQCVGRVGEGLGLAVKVLDGAKRAKYATTIHLLVQLGWLSPEAAESLASRYINLSPFKRLDIIGELKML